MRFEGNMRRFAPTLALTTALALSGCGMGSVDGVPLAELDTSGEAPANIVLGGSDRVVITEGDGFTVTIDGDDQAREDLRFDLDDNTLAIARDSDDWSGGEQAVISITIPAPRSLVLGGSGEMITDALAQDAELIIGGSGEIGGSGIDVDSLEIVIGGSGRVDLAGSANSLELTIGGSGTANMPDLSVDDAEVNIGGSGDATFASDGTVEANIGGSGNVRVRGNATCTINAMGSGSLVCEEVEEAPETSSEDGELAIANDDSEG